MNKIKFPVFILLAIIISVSVGWYFGRQSGVKLGSDVLKTQAYGNAFTKLVEIQSIIEAIDSNHIEDAKNTLYMSEGGAIFALANLLESSDISSADMKILLEMHESNQTAYGSQQDVLNKFLARVAKYRTEHPWTYTGKMPHLNDAEAQARLADILKRASESQK